MGAGQTQTRKGTAVPYGWKSSGPVIISGDLWPFSERVSHNGVPPENVDRAATLASMDRILKAASNLHAKIVIQHEAGIANAASVP